MGRVRTQHSTAQGARDGEADKHGADVAGDEARRGRADAWPRREDDVAEGRARVQLLDVPVRLRARGAMTPSDSSREENGTL